METQLDGHNALLLSARGAHLRRDWETSYEAFVQASQAAPLDTDDLDALAAAAWRLGQCKESLRYSEQVFKQLSRSDPTAAAMKAVDVALAWLTRGDLNVGQGWMNRARRLLEGASDSPTSGYLAYLDAYIATCAGDAGALQRQVDTLRDMSARLDTPAMASLCAVVEALAAIGEARMADAFSLIDEALLTVLADELPIEWAGDIYCLVLHHCNRVADLPRMRAWTQSMERWCDNFATVVYGGVCEMHRLHLLTATEDYRLIEDRLFLASRKLEDVNTFAAAAGFYELGEIRRLRGDVEGAVAAFAQARSLGVDPQPGEALLQHSQGDSESAWTALQASLAWQDRVGRIRLLRPAVEVALHRGAPMKPRRCVANSKAEQRLSALPGSGPGRRTLAERCWCGAAITVRRSKRCRPRCGNTECSGAGMKRPRSTNVWRLRTKLWETTTSRRQTLRPRKVSTLSSASTEHRVGSASRRPDPARDRDSDPDRQRGDQQAGGRSVFISDKTVGRHLANIYAKLGVSSRTAAVSWAYANKVVDNAGRAE